MIKEKECYCKDCGCVFRSAEDRAPDCPGCKSHETYWNLKFKVGRSGKYRNPIHSDAMAISPDQRAEHEKLFPNIRLDKECRPVFDNVRDHDDYLKRTGFVKHPKKIKTLGRERIYP